MLSNNKIAAVILAAGKGTRMKSDLPKVMHLINNKPLIEYVWENVFNSGCFSKIIVVVAKDNNLVQDYLGDRAEYAIQTEQLGTGHAVMAAESILLGQAHTVAVFYGDMPFLRPESIKRLIEVHETEKATMSLITATVENFDGVNNVFKTFGRIIRDLDGKIVKVVEYKDATIEELEIKEISTCFYCFQAEWLWNNLKKLKTKNAQQEYYLPDLVGIAITDKEKVSTIEIDSKEAMGINTLDDLLKAQNTL